MGQTRAPYLEVSRRLSQASQICEGEVAEIEAVTPKRAKVLLVGETIPLILDVKHPFQIRLGDRVAFSGLIDHDGLFAASAYHNHTQSCSGNSINPLLLVAAIIGGLIWLMALFLQQHHPGFFLLFLLVIYLSRLYWGQLKGARSLKAHIGSISS